MENINDNLTMLLIGFEFLLVLMFLITLSYSIVQHFRKCKEARVTAKKYAIYNKYKL